MTAQLKRAAKATTNVSPEPVTKGKRGSFVFAAGRQMPWCPGGTAGRNSGHRCPRC
ncbi:hypothetical protein ACWD0Z_15975 [Streptomyces sp. NPDC003007]